MARRDIQTFDWNEYQCAKLARLWAQTNPVITVAEMAKQMGVTKDSLVRKVEREHLPSRRDPVTRPPPPKPISLTHPDRQRSALNVALPPFHSISWGCLTASHAWEDDDALTAA